jgi:hypothetical protein
MHPSIQIAHDSKRGCGWRKVGGLYLRCDDFGVPCGVLPLELKGCPTCAAMGLKCRTIPSRGFTWIDPSRLFDWKSVACPHNPEYVGLCRDCSMSMIARNEHCGLLWVGEKFYPTPEDFDKESRALGISRRLPHDQLPRGFKVGEDFIMLAHKKAVLHASEGGDRLFDYFPGVFRIFKPQRIEVIVTGDESDEKIEGYIERNFIPTKVERT